MSYAVCCVWCGDAVISVICAARPARPAPPARPVLHYFTSLLI